MTPTFKERAEKIAERTAEVDPEVCWLAGIVAELCDELDRVKSAAKQAEEKAERTVVQLQHALNR